jgi:hypothetical protein
MAIANTTLIQQWLNEEKLKSLLLNKRPFEEYFEELDQVKSVPKYMGSKIKRYHYGPILEDK